MSAVAQRVGLILRSQYHAVNAAALQEQAIGNIGVAEELREAAEHFDLLAEAVEDDLLNELDKRRMTRRLFEANGEHIDFSAYSEAQLAGQACSSCGYELGGAWTETTLLGPRGRMVRHRRWQDCTVEVPF